MPGKTSTFYKNNEASRKKRLEYQKEYNKKDREVKKRVELTKENRKRGTYGNGDGKDLAHTKNGLKLQKASVNRGSKTAMPGDKRARGNGRQK